MKRSIVFNRLAIILVFSFAIFAFACKKDTPSAKLDSKQYVLYNYSSGTAVESGTFTINELEDGNASLSISLSQGFLVQGVTMPSYITTSAESGTDLTVSILQPVDGTSGKSMTSPVKTSDNLTIKYADLITKTNYSVKVLNNTNVQAKGDLK